MCNVFTGMGGGDCTGLCANGVMLLLTNLLNLLFGFSLFVISSYHSFHVFKWKSNWKMDPVDVEVYTFKISEGAFNSADDIDAYAWLSLAANAGDKVSASRLNRLKSRLNYKQISEGAERAAAVTKRLQEKQK